MKRIISSVSVLFCMTFLFACAAGPDPMRHPWGVKIYGWHDFNDDNNVKDSPGGGLAGTVQFTDFLSAELNLNRTQTEWNIVNDGTDEDATVDETMGNLLLKVHFTERQPLQVYLGAGVNHILYSGEDPHSESTLVDLDIDDETGFTIVAGAKTYLGPRGPIESEWRNWYFFTELWKVYNEVNQEATATLTELEHSNDGWFVVMGFTRQF